MKKDLQSFIRNVARNIAVLLILLNFSLFLPSQVSAQQVEWTGLCVSQGVATIKGLECLVANVFMVVITVIGLAAFIMLIVSAFRMQFSGGNTKGMETARNTMTFAVVGIIVSLSAFIVINLIADFTGVQEIKIFEIPDSSM